MKFSYSWLSEYVKKVPAPEKLAELLTMHCYQVEGVEKNGKDFVLDIDVLPNRMPDSSGHIGVAREISILTKSPIAVKEYPIKKTGAQIATYMKASVAPRGTHRYILAVLDEISVKDSPAWIRDRLVACGLRPINAIVDATNYIMLETGHPAHAFDLDKVVQPISVRYARAGEKMTTLDGQEIFLTPEDLLIADGQGPLALAGVKGGTRAEITRDTKRVVFEVAAFDRTMIRRTSKRHSIMTDASFRFSRGLSHAALDRVAARLVGLAQTLVGGSAAAGFIDIQKTRAPKITIPFRADYASRLLGATISEREMLDILKRIGAHATQKKAGVFYVMPPAWRMDLECEEDLIEEVGRIYGFEHIAARPAEVELIHPKENQDHAVADEVRDILVSLGFYEIETNSFERADTLTHKDRAQIANPFSEEYAYMRSTLTRGLIEACLKNRAYAEKRRFFEIGTIFRGGGETMHIAFALSGNGSSRELYYEIKGTAESLLEQAGIADHWFEEVGSRAVSWPFAPRAYFHPHRAAFIQSDSKTLGVLYQVHPDYADGDDIVICEILFRPFADLIEREHTFERIPRYPAITRDLAILVDKDARVDEVLDVIENAGGMLLENTDLFDYYEGSEIGEDHKSLAFHLVFQVPDRTLTDEDVAKVFKKIIKAVRAAGWEVRG